MEKALKKSMLIDKTRINTRTLVFDSILMGYVFVCILVGILHPTKQQWLDLSTNSLIFGFCILVGAVLSYTLNVTGTKTLGGLIFESEHLKGKGEVQSMFTTFWGFQFIIAFGITLYVGFVVTNFSFYELMSEQGFAGAKRMFTSMATPNFEILPHAILAIIETIYIAFIATILSIPVAFLLSFLAAKNIMDGTILGSAVYFTIRVLMNMMRSIEPLIWAIIFSVWVGIGPFAGMLALMIQTIASLTKQFSEFIEGVNDGPIEGIQATGAHPIQVVWFAIVPQIVLPFISYTIYRWDTNVRMATIIGLVGGGGIGTMLIQYQGQAMWHEVGTLALLIVAVVWAMDTASAYIREALK